MTSSPTDENQRATSGLRAADPEMKNRIRPPNRSRTFASTSRSASACWAARAAPGSSPFSRAAATWLPTSSAQSTSRFLTPVSPANSEADPRVRLLEDAGRGAHEGRPDHREVVDDLVDAPVDGRGEADLQRQHEQDLAEDVRERQPQELQVVRREQRDGVDGGALVDERVVGEQDALGPAGRAGRVDDDGQVLGRQRVDAVVDRDGSAPSRSRPSSASRSAADDPVAVGAVPACRPCRRR